MNAFLIINDGYGDTQGPFSNMPQLPLKRQRVHPSSLKRQRVIIKYFPKWRPSMLCCGGRWSGAAEKLKFGPADDSASPNIVDHQK